MLQQLSVGMTDELLGLKKARKGSIAKNGLRKN
jgi:hypothetical protein